MNKNKKIFILLSTYLCFLFIPKSNTLKYIKNTNYIYNSVEPFSYCDNGNIYIVNDYIIDHIYNKNTNDIYVIDQRNNMDPNMQIINSYKVTSRKQMIEILKVLNEYEKDYPSRWNRTKNSMLNEWFIHNICHQLGIKTINSESVDLNNEDETKYTILSLNK